MEKEEQELAEKIWNGWRYQAGIPAQIRSITWLDLGELCTNLEVARDYVWLCLNAAKTAIEARKK